MRGACAHGGAGVRVRFNFSRAASPQPMEEEAVQGEPVVVVKVVEAASRRRWRRPQRRRAARPVAMRRPRVWAPSGVGGASRGGRLGPV